jgi:hypothetical protein
MGVGPAAPPRLLLVEGEVLHHGHHARPLHTLDIRNGESRPEVRVVAREVLKVAPTAGNAVDVDRRPQNRVCALGGKLATQGSRKLAHQRTVPRGGHREQARPASDRADELRPVGAEPTRVVLHVQRRQSKPWNGRDVAHAVFRQNINQAMHGLDARAVVSTGKARQHTVQGNEIETGRRRTRTTC